MPGAKGSVKGLGSGFGHLRNGEMTPGAPLPDPIGTGEPSEDLKQIAEDINAIREQFVLADLLQPTIINLAAGTSQIINSLTNEVGSIIVTVTAGQLDVWFGERSGVVAGTIPHLSFQVVGAPIQIVLPPAPRIFTVLANGALTQGCFILSSI